MSRYYGDAPYGEDNKYYQLFQVKKSLVHEFLSEIKDGYASTEEHWGNYREYQLWEIRCREIDDQNKRMNSWLKVLIRGKRPLLEKPKQPESKFYNTYTQCYPTIEKEYETVHSFVFIVNFVHREDDYRKHCPDNDSYIEGLKKKYHSESWEQSYIEVLQQKDNCALRLK